MMTPPRSPEVDTIAACTSRRQALSLMLSGLPFWFAAEAAGAVDPVIRVAMSETLVADVNLNDARAAMTVWTEQLVKDLGLPLQTSPGVFDTSEQIFHKLRTNQVDAVALNYLEYRAVSGLLDSSEIITSVDRTRSQYVLLVKKDAGFRELSDLRGHSLIQLDDPPMCLAPAWLSTILFEDHLEQPEQFFGALERQTKPTRVVLPVFFGQADACITSLGSFNTMCELNPQVSKQLVVLARSSELVASFHAFRKAFHGPLREQFKTVLLGIGGTPTGEQLMMLFQFDQLMVRNGDCLSDSLRLLETSERARSEAGGGER